MDENRSYVQRENIKLIYSALCQYLAEHHYPPSIRELTRLTGFKSTSSIHAYLTMMREDGIIDFEPEQRRTIHILTQI